MAFAKVPQEIYEIRDCHELSVICWATTSLSKFNAAVTAIAFKLIICIRTFGDTEPGIDQILH